MEDFLENFLFEQDCLYFSGGRAFGLSLSITHDENDGQVLEDCVDWDLQELLLEIESSSQKGKSRPRFRSISSWSFRFERQV